jgi:hypothetical protein
MRREALDGFREAAGTILGGPAAVVGMTVGLFLLIEVVVVLMGGSLPGDSAWASVFSVDGLVTAVKLILLIAGSWVAFFALALPLMLMLLLWEWHQGRGLVSTSDSEPAIQDSPPSQATTTALPSGKVERELAAHVPEHAVRWWLRLCGRVAYGLGLAYLVSAILRGWP